MLREKEEIVKQYESDVSKKDQMIAIEGGHRQDAILELAQVGEATQEERCTMNEKSIEAEFWKSTAKGMHDEYLEEMRKLQEQLMNREAMIKQEESFVRQLDADNEELRTFKKLEIQEGSNKRDEHRERAVVKRLEGGPQLDSVREDKKMAGTYPSSSSNSIPNSSLVPGSILFPSFGDPMIDVHLSQMQGVVGMVPQPTTTTDGGGNGGGNNGATPPLDYNGFSPSGNQQRPGRRHLSLTGGGGGPPDDPPDDEDEDDDDEEDEEDEEEEEDSRTRRGRRRLRDDREVKNERLRISRKEAERVSIPIWPKIHQLANWKMQLLMNVLSACADPNTDAWTRWLEQALGLNPDLNLLSDSGGDRFATIDIKMAMGMQNMMRQAPDEAKDVYLDATRHWELRHQQGVIVKGRELVALVMQSFRTSDRTDLVYHIEHLFNLDFPGDKNLVVFRNKWYDLLLKMRNEDRPSPLALRAILYRKIKASKKMEFGLNAYHRLPDKHPQKSYEFLLALIDHQIKSDREDLMLDTKEKSVKSMMKSGGKDPKAKAKGHAGKNGKCDGAND